jgi:NADPH-dependent curcumin reductase
LIAHYGDPEGADARAALMARGEPIFRERGVTVRDLFVGDYVAEHHEAFLRDMAGWVAAGDVRYHEAFLRDMGGWVAAGDVRYLEDIREGLETVPLAFAEMLRGGNFGKMLVRISDDPTL